MIIKHLTRCVCCCSCSCCDPCYRVLPLSGCAASCCCCRWCCCRKQQGSRTRPPHRLLLTTYHASAPLAWAPTKSRTSQTAQATTSAAVETHQLCARHAGELSGVPTELSVTASGHSTKFTAVAAAAAPAAAVMLSSTAFRKSWCPLLVAVKLRTLALSWSCRGAQLACKHVHVAETTDSMCMLLTRSVCALLSAGTSLGRPGSTSRCWQRRTTPRQELALSEWCWA
jgi:hypothetical protein